MYKLNYNTVLYNYYRYIRQANPHIPAWRVLEYIKAIKQEHTLKVLQTISSFHKTCK